MSIAEWLDCGIVYKLYESMLRLVKDAENVDQRQNCFLLQTSNGVSRYFSMETKQGLLDVQCAWHRSICTSMMHIKVRTNFGSGFRITRTAKRDSLRSRIRSAAAGTRWNVSFSNRTRPQRRRSRKIVGPISAGNL